MVLIRLVACVLAALSAAGVALGAEPVTIGEINPRTGVLVIQGTAIHQGILLAVEEANARGGVAGRRVTLLSRDDEGKPERAIASAEELIARHRAVALIGGYVDSLVGPIAEVAERTKTPYLATASLDERLTGKGNRYFFRISSLAPYVAAMTGIVSEVFRAGSVAILYSHTPGAAQLAKKQKEIFEKAGVRVTVFEPFAPGLSDFTPLLGRIQREGAEVLISNTFFADHLLLVRQMAQTGIKARAFLGAFGMEFPAVIKEMGPASEGLFGTTTWQPGVTLAGREAESRAFIEAFSRRFGREPAPLAMHGYAAAKTLLAALSTAGTALSGEALREALARADVETPMGRVRFNEAGDPLHYERMIIQVQGGRHVIVYPPSRATAPAIYPVK